MISIKKFISQGYADEGQHRFIVICILLLVLLGLTACTDYEGIVDDKYEEWKASVDDIDYGEFTDARDGQAYKTVTIGTQTWMAENLNYNTSDSYCYDNNASNCSKYGRLYTWWAAAMKACPSGWHLPSDTEWNTLWTAVGGTGTAGRSLKSTSGWSSNDNGTDSFGFAVLPAGYRSRYGDFLAKGDYAYFWSSSEVSSGYAYYWYFRYGDDYVYRNYINKNYGYSVRCLWDSSDEGSVATSSSSQAQPSSSSSDIILSSSSSVIPDPDRGSSGSIASSLSKPRKTA